MFEHLTRRFLHRRRRNLRYGTRFFAAYCLLEERELLSGANLSLISENLQNNGADIWALFPSVSANGQYVAFESGSFSGTLTPAPSDLVQGLPVENDAPNVYLRTVANNTTICLSVNYQSPTSTGNDDSRYPIISANGNTVVFLSNATNLVANDNPSNNPNDDMNVFAWSRETGKLTLVTSNVTGYRPGERPQPAAIRHGGEHQRQFQRRLHRLRQCGDEPGLRRERHQLHPKCLCLRPPDKQEYPCSAADSGGGIGNGPSDDPVMSSDGSTIAFDSWPATSTRSSQPGTVRELPGLCERAQLHERHRHQHVARKCEHSRHRGRQRHLNRPELERQRRDARLQAPSNNLVNTPNGGSFNDVYVRNLSTKTTQLVSIDHTGDATGDSSSFAPQMSGDGDHVLFYSLADDLTTNSLGTQKNVFERNLTTNTTQLVSVSSAGSGGANGTSTLANQTTENSANRLPDK